MSLCLSGLKNLDFTKINFPKKFTFDPIQTYNFLLSAKKLNCHFQIINSQVFAKFFVLCISDPQNCQIPYF